MTDPPPSTVGDGPTGGGPTDGGPTDGGPTDAGSSAGSSADVRSGSRPARSSRRPLPPGLAAVRARRWGRRLVAPTFAVLDLETTGLDPAHDRVIEVAVVTTDERGRVLDEWSSLIDPARDPGPVHVHGITAEQLAQAAPFATVAADLGPRLRNRVVVAHNLPFDAGFLAAEAARSGPAGPAGLLDEVVGGLCTLDLSRQLLTRPTTGWSLGSLCAATGVALDDPHRALADARATAGLLAVLLRRLPRRPLPFTRRLTIDR